MKTHITFHSAWGVCYSSQSCLFTFTPSIYMYHIVNILSLSGMIMINPHRQIGLQNLKKIDKNLKKNECWRVILHHYLWSFTRNIIIMPRNFDLWPLTFELIHIIIKIYHQWGFPVQNFGSVPQKVQLNTDIHRRDPFYTLDHRYGMKKISFKFLAM